MIFFRKLYDIFHPVIWSYRQCYDLGSNTTFRFEKAPTDFINTFPRNKKIETAKFRKEIEYEQLALNKKVLNTAFISPGFAPLDIDYKKLFFALKTQCESDTELA